MEEVFPGEVLYYFEQVFAILGNFRTGMADKCYEEKGQCLDKAGQGPLSAVQKRLRLSERFNRVPKKFRVLTELRGDGRLSCPV